MFLGISCSNPNQTIQFEKSQTKNELMAHLRFLASDELKGRKVGTPETKIAARYIAEQFRAAGLQNFKSTNNFLQPTEFTIDNKKICCNNVVGFIEGTNPVLKNEYILLCAHYDHLGTKRDPKFPGRDSIFNGARDNAMGVTTLIYAARKLSKQTAERSLIFLASTGEEEGMLGSKYFIEHCPVSTNQIVFVLNNDGGGFNDTTIIRIGGKNKIDFPTGFWHTLEKNINWLAYPPELEYLYEKGDNITFANKGIPSAIISPGFDTIDEEILKYVHQPADEADDNFDCNYLLKFGRSYADCILKIANSKTTPSWKKNCRYFFISKILYENINHQKTVSIREKINKTML